MLAALTEPAVSPSCCSLVTYVTLEGGIYDCDNHAIPVDYEGSVYYGLLT